MTFNTQEEQKQAQALEKVIDKATMKAVPATQKTDEGKEIYQEYIDMASKTGLKRQKVIKMTESWHFNTKAHDAAYEIQLQPPKSYIKMGFEALKGATKYWTGAFNPLSYSSYVIDAVKKFGEYVGNTIEKKDSKLCNGAQKEFVKAMSKKVKTMTQNYIDNVIYSKVVPFVITARKNDPERGEGFLSNTVYLIRDLTADIDCLLEEVEKLTK